MKGTKDFLLNLPLEKKLGKLLLDYLVDTILKSHWNGRKLGREIKRWESDRHAWAAIARISFEHKVNRRTAKRILAREVEERVTEINFLLDNKNSIQRHKSKDFRFFLLGWTILDQRLLYQHYPIFTQILLKIKRGSR